ncbi:MAG: hypothetical protein WBA88_26315 [Pseudaminobacter sp.]
MTKVDDAEGLPEKIGTALGALFIAATFGLLIWTAFRNLIEPTAEDERRL